MPSPSPLSLPPLQTHILLLAGSAKGQLPPPSVVLPRLDETPGGPRPAFSHEPVLAHEQGPREGSQLGLPFL